MALKESFTSIALPRLATGVGGLEWSDVQPVIEDRLGALGIPVFVYNVYTCQGRERARDGRARTRRLVVTDGPPQAPLHGHTKAPAATGGRRWVAPCRQASPTP